MTGGPDPGGSTLDTRGRGTGRVPPNVRPGREPEWVSDELGLPEPPPTRERMGSERLTGLCFEHEEGAGVGPLTFGPSLYTSKVPTCLSDLCKGLNDLVETPYSPVVAPS